MSERRVLAIRGIVQGVGFRPYIQGLATSFDLRGRVHNDQSGLHVDIEGPGEALDAFLEALRLTPPPLAAVDDITVERAPLAAHRGFHVAPSDLSGEPNALVAPDAATCAACVAELHDPANRRYRHPFISCTNCGPRFTIARDVPWDRSRTTMLAYAPCANCDREYHDPADRRFHAETIACPECGPVLGLFDVDVALAHGDGALTRAVAALRAGAIVAVKGLGGFHLCCDARDEAAVQRLRARKQREAKPLAISVADTVAAREIALVSEAEATLLESSARPIVLLASRTDSGIAASVAPGVGSIGVMLPYTPLQHLLLADFGAPLVMTSGNRSDEPLAYTDADAITRLAGIADCFLTHDRVIASRCDDSVLRVAAGGPIVTRLGRGQAPRPLRLAERFPVPVLALGGHLKNAFCLGRGNLAFLSHHIGDLGHPAAVQSLSESIAHYCRLFGIEPQLVVHDLHPDYATTRLAESMALPSLAVQHHHAHVASCAAEHGVRGPLLGVAFDGSGAGTDGAVWGGEFLLVEGGRFQRLGQLGYVPMPGGEAAVREPWRMAVAHLFHTCGSEAEEWCARLLKPRASELALMRQMLSRGFRSPPTSSVGRLFDAVAALLGLRSHAQYEAQAAIELEAIADHNCTRSYAPLLRTEGDRLVADPAAIIGGVLRDVQRGRRPAEIAGTVHNAVRDVIVTVIERLAQQSGVRRVALTGGVFQNVLLLEGTVRALSALGYEVLVQRRVPCNDGGLALGQAVVAAAQWSESQHGA